MPKRNVDDVGGAIAEFEQIKKRRPHRQIARQKLIDAAHSVMSKSGLDGCTISEIVAAAGVGSGSFYNNFQSKEHLARVVFESMLDELGKSIADVALFADDPAIAACFAIRTVIEKAERDSVWGAFMIQLEPTLRMLDAHLRKYAQLGMRQGVEKGRFVVADQKVTVTLLHTMEVGVIGAMLRQEISSQQAHASVEYMLRMLGVPQSEAAEYANLPMDELKRRANADDDVPDQPRPKGATGVSVAVRRSQRQSLL
jgi:AcrR family transcriptional regulator